MSRPESTIDYYYNAKGEWVKRPEREPPFVLYFGLPLVGSCGEIIGLTLCPG